MKSKIQFVHTSPNDKLEKMVKTYLMRVEKKYDWIIRASAILSRGEPSLTRNRCCKIELSVPGENIFEESCEESFERAIVESFEKLNRQLHWHKRKLYRSVD